MIGARERADYSSGVFGDGRTGGAIATPSRGPRPPSRTKVRLGAAGVEVAVSGSA